MNTTDVRLLRTITPAALATLLLSTNVFVSADRVRAKVLEKPTRATNGLVRVTTAGFPQVNELRAPFALIARINSSSEGSPFVISVDGALVCRRDVSPGDSRVDCAVSEPWNGTTEHEVTIEGPPSSEWTLDSLELATHHGNTTGAHFLIILPAASDRYVRPGVGWVIGTFVMLAAALWLLPASPPLRRWIRLLYWVVVGIAVLELAVILCSRWISDYRIVMSAGTFTRLLILLFAPRLWYAGRLLWAPGATDAEFRPVSRASMALVVAIAFCAVGVAAWEPVLKDQWEQIQIRRRAEQAERRAVESRNKLFAELQPVGLGNCEFQRFGEANDGGYLLCANLLAAVQSGYSYGISGYDQWGCDVSLRLSVPLHQYDCFNLTQPVCPGGRTVFHGECIGQKPETIDGRPFDSLENQAIRNGDGDKHLVVKMDVEGAEWDSLLETPDPVFERIDQLTIELHGVSEPERFLAVVAKLKQFFYVANLHFNNFACLEGIAPFPAEVYEVLFVNKKVAVLGGSGPPGAPRSLMTPNIPKWKDCQSLADLPPVRENFAPGQN